MAFQAAWSRHRRDVRCSFASIPLKFSVLGDEVVGPPADRLTLTRIVNFINDELWRRLLGPTTRGA